MRRILGARATPFVWATVTAVAVVLEAPSALRVPLAGGLTLLCPGLAWVRLVRLRDLSAEVSLALTVSLAASISTAALVVHLGLSTTDSLFALVAITYMGGLLQALLRPPSLARDVT